jgi:copper chaperone CopZ
MGIKEMKLKVEGIPCAGCAEDYERFLNNTEGTLQASVNYTEHIISMRYDSGDIDRKQAHAFARKLVRMATILDELII